MNRLAPYLSRHLPRKLALRHRLAGVLVLLSLLPLALSSVIAHTEASVAERRRSAALATEVARQVAKNIGVEMARLESDSEVLVRSDRILAALADYADADEARRTAARSTT